MPAQRCGENDQAQCCTPQGESFEGEMLVDAKPSETDGPPLMASMNSTNPATDAARHIQVRVEAHRAPVLPLGAVARMIIQRDWMAGRVCPDRRNLMGDVWSSCLTPAMLIILG